MVASATIRSILALAIAAFGLASLVHGGVLISGGEHRQAATAEGVIALVLLAALAASWVWPHAARGIALGAEGFALLGTLVGAVMIIIGVGPRTRPDIVFHALLIVGLTAGLATTWRQRAGRHRQPST